ncbi:MAG: tRNA pseudouridine(55) synthase TruB [bacterium JZ-2024 1]
MNGFVGIFKPPGMTSFDVIRFLRRYSTTQKMGHTGTIDRLGSGVLVVAIGRATRLIPLLEGTKEYIAEMTLGITTDTGDAEGQIRENRSATARVVEMDEVNALISRYRGEILQKPPSASAKKVGGRRASDLYRAGVAVPLKPHSVRIHDIKVLRVSSDLPQRFTLHISCSTGTYVRALAESIGEDLGTGAYISFLVRTFSHPFSLDDCVTLQEVAQSGTLQPFVRPSDAGLQQLPDARLVSRDARRFVNGTSIRLYPPQFAPMWRVYDPDGRFLGVGILQGHLLTPHKVVDGGNNGTA